MTGVFLSYARGDDGPFVRKLHGDLTADGFDVWFDREDMPQRQLPFPQEIADAIRGRDRPGALPEAGEPMSRAGNGGAVWIIVH